MSYRLSPAARADLRSIWLYTAETWSSSPAGHYVTSIEAACRNLADGTIRGRSAERYRAQCMSLAAGSHFVFYKTPERGSVDIIRILHQRINIAAQLSE